MEMRCTSSVQRCSLDKCWPGQHLLWGHCWGCRGCSGAASPGSHQSKTWNKSPSLTKAPILKNTKDKFLGLLHWEPKHIQTKRLVLILLQPGEEVVRGGEQPPPLRCTVIMCFSCTTFHYQFYRPPPWLKGQCNSSVVTHSDRNLISSIFHINKNVRHSPQSKR